MDPKRRRSASQRAPNEELPHAQSALEDTPDRFIELYDFAPSGYLTFDRHGVIQQINLTGAALLGKPRQNIEGLPLFGFIAESDRGRLLDFLRRCRKGEDGLALNAELTLDVAGGIRYVELLCTPRLQGARHGREYLSAMVDITERRRLEAERAAVAAERAALLSRLITAQDEERRRIARDLHDDLGQLVTALRLNFEMIVGVHGHEGVERQVAETDRILRTLDQRLSFLAGALRPASLNLGIASALEQYVSEWSKTFQIESEFTTVGLDRTRLQPEVETHIYRVAQEALNNVVKHAAATRVTVVLQQLHPNVVLIVQDNGRGFEPSRRTGQGTPEGFGLLGMRERAVLAGGTLDVESAPGQGTTVSLSVPATATRGLARRAGS